LVCLLGQPPQARGVNCLVLDEPTNHLDLPAAEQLESTLDGFAGTVVLVTLERVLFERFGVGRVLSFEGGVSQKETVP